MESSTRTGGDQEEPLRSLAAALLHHVSEGSAGTAAPLEQLYEHFKDKTWKTASSDVLLSVWSACVSVLGTDNGPEDCARALHIIRSLSQLCTRCGTALFADWAALGPGKVGAAVAATMARHPSSVTVQTAGCALYARLTGCAACHTHSAPELVAVVVAAGAVPALASAVRGLDARTAEPAAVVCAAEALAALRFMAEAVPGALDAVDGGTLALAATAREVAAGQGSADHHAVALLAAVAARPETRAADALAAAVQAVAVADAAAPGPAFLLAARGLIALPETLKARPDVYPPQLASFQQTTAEASLRHLRTAAAADGTVSTWMALLSAVVRSTDAQSPTVPALTDPQTVLLIARVASSSVSPDVAADATRSLWALSPVCASMDAAASTCVADSVSAALAMLVAAPVAEGAKSPSPDVAAGLVCGAACLGALETCGVQPSTPLGADTLRYCLLSGLDGLALPGAEWDESRVGWNALDEALCAVLRFGDVKAAATDGHTLVHALAARGQSRCLGLVLEVAGNGVDLLARTKAGDTALQLARQGRHDTAAALLDGVTQRAAEARQAALLAELEETAESNESSAKKSGSKKKKAVSRSSSLAADQPEEKAQKVADDEAEAVAAESARAELRARMEEEYELALELRRQELAAAAAAAEAAATVRQEEEMARGTAVAMSTDGRSSSAERPCTPRTSLDAGAADGSGPGSSSGSGGDDDAMTRTESDSGVASADDSTLDLSAQAAEPDADADAQALMSDIAAATSPFANLMGHPTAAVPARVGAPGPGSPSPAPIAREHSLFGSPSLTGDLFGGASFTSSLANHSSLSGSPTMATAPLGGLGLHSEGPGALPDALFVAPMGMRAGVEQPSVAPTLPSASLLASLASGGMRPLPVSPPRTASLPPLPHPPGSPTMSPAALRGAGSSSSDGDSDACAEPTRHLWIGNLGTRTARAVLKAVFEAHGMVEDVVTFPGRMYAFVNYTSAEEAAAATEALHNKVVPELTGDRPLLLKYRPVKKAAMHLRALGEGLGSVSATSDDGVAGGPGSARGDPDGNSSDPSPRIWLGNIAPTATSKTLQAVLGRFGPLTDAAVFPARIGPLGYAFVKFEALDDAVRALEALNNTVVPPLSGSKQLKMRYKPAGSGPAGRGDEAAESSKSITMPSRHLWLGNITQKPPEDAIFKAFSKYGRVDSARVFPAKAYAFVNFADVGAAVRAMADLEGVPIPALTGVKPLVMRFQQESQQPARPAGAGAGAAASAAAGAAAAAASAAAGFGMGGLGSLGMHRVQSESALALAAAASLNRLQPVLSGFGRADSLSGHDDGWGAVAAHDSMHRSSSLGLLAPPAGAGGGFHSARPSPTASPFGALMGEPSPAGPPSLAPAASASSSQLSAVLSNLAALQRAASGGMPPHSAQQSPQDIAALSSMLASQSITPPEVQSVGPSPGWSPADPGPVGPASHGGGLDGLLCPLSQQLMTDPVVAADGVTYHRPAIMHWLATQAVSPVTQTPLAHASLVPNHAVKDAVMGYLRVHLRVAA